MFYFPHDDMQPHKFIEVHLPTTREIFSRTGKLAVVSPDMYSGDEALPQSMSKTDMLDESRRYFETRAAALVEESGSIVRTGDE